MRHLNLHHLRLFRAVARDGTLTGAARRLNLSQSALSTQLRALEASLGHDLFERRGRGLLMTEAGRIALDHAEAIFRTVDDLTGTLREMERVRRAVRVEALATLSRNFQMQFLRPLIGRPDVEVVLRSGSQEELLRGLQGLALDVVLTNLAPARDAASPWLVHRIDEQPVGLIGTPARLGPVPRPVRELLESQPLILPKRETGLRAAFDGLAAKLEVTSDRCSRGRRHGDDPPAGAGRCRSGDHPADRRARRTSLGSPDRGGLSGRPQRNLPCPHRNAAFSEPAPERGVAGITARRIALRPFRP